MKRVRTITLGAATGTIVGALAMLASLVVAPPVAAASPASPDAPWVVSLGDSYISGEAGRWAGSSDVSDTYADALGPTAYYDNPDHTAEVIPRCHRSQSAEIYLGRGLQGVNFACSGATTGTHTSDDGYFKPGLDFYDDGAGHLGQATLLQNFATSHEVDMVVVSIGGNDLQFSDIVTQCVLDFLTSSILDPNYCNDDAVVTSVFTPENLKAVRIKIAAALQNVRQAMRAAGYADDAWTLLVQNYPSPIPDGAGFRYSEAGFTRQTVGGCGFWNADADWANSYALPKIDKTVKKSVKKAKLTNTKLLNLATAFNGRRLCENTVGLYEEEGLTSWQQPGAVDKTEWINQIRITADGNPYYLQESLHPNYWAQMALRSCVRQAYNGGAVTGGKCKINGTGLVDGEPVMKLRRK